jgi:hypothetical protein
VFSAGTVQSDYKEVFGSIEQYRTEVLEWRVEFEMPACRDMSWGAEELN